MRITHFFHGAALASVLAFGTPSMAQNDATEGSTSPVVVVKGVPLTPYGNLPAIEDIDLSPDGSRSAAIATVNGQRRIMALDADDKIIANVPLMDQKIIGIRWAGNDYLIVEMRRTAAIAPGEPIQEFSMAAVINLNKNGEVFWVFEKKPEMLPVTAGSYGIRKIEGRWYAFFGGYRATDRHATNILSNAEFQLFKVDLENGKATSVAKPRDRSNDRDWMLGEDGSVIATLDEDSDTGKWSIKNKDGTTIAAGQHKDRGVGMAGLSPDGTHLYYFIFDEANQDSKLLEIALTDGTPRTPVTVPDKAEQFYTADTSERVVGWREDKFGAMPVFFDEKSNASVKALQAAFPDSIISVGDFSEDLNMIVFKTQGPGDSGTWFQLDVSQRNAWPLGKDYPDIKPAQVGEIRTMTYTAQDGLEIEMIVTMPPGLEPKNLPVIMLPHGGPHAHDEPRFDWWAQAMASRGYVVAQPNFRGSTNKDLAFREAGYGKWGAEMQTDVSDGLNYLAGLGIVDPKRACIVGASYGGYAALAGVTIQQGIYRCAVSVAGVSDLPLQIDDGLKKSGNSKALDRYFDKAIGKGRDLVAISPAYHAEKADAPILLIHGRDDTVVYINQSDRMADKLSDAGKPFEYVKLRGEDHWLSRGASRLSMLEATVAFVEKHNPPGPLAE